MRFVLPLAALAFVLGGCGSTPPATAQGTISATDFERDATPFEIAESDGPLAHPFSGGFWGPIPQLIDLTGDGAPDLTVNVGGAGIGFYENTPSGWQWRTGQIGGIRPGPWYRLGDLDGDGDADLITRGEPGRARYYENTGTPEAATFTLRADPLMTAAGTVLQIEDTSVPALSDTDGDGDLDIVAGKADLGTITYYRYERIENGIPVYVRETEEWQGIQIFEGNPQCTENLGALPASGDALRATRHGANSVTLANLAGNAAPELFWGDFFSERLFYFLNSGTPEAPSFDLITEDFPVTAESTPGGQNSAAFGDTDGDGDLDLVVGVIGGLCVTSLTPTENLTFFRNTGTPEAPDFERVTTDVLPSLDRGRRSVPAFADLDGDGDLDMVVGDGNTDANLALYTNVGASGAPRYALTDADWLGLDYDFGGYAPVFGDLDADGDLDLLVGGFNGRMAYLENTGSATSPEFVLREQRFGDIDAGQYAKPTLADLDGDGDLDLALGESNGRVFLYRNTGSPQSPAFTTASNGTPGDTDLAFRDAIGLPDDVGQESSPAFADLDGDGDLDALLGSSTGEILIFRNAGTPEAPAFEDAGALSGDRLTTVPRAADVTGDGRPEIISGADSGGLLYWANTYSTATAPGPIGSLRLDAFPNPTSGAVRVQFGRVVRGDLIVRDALGREVRRMPVAADEATWDGRDASGDAAPAGAYWLMLDSDPARPAQVTIAN